MDVIVELLGEILFEVPLDLTMGSRRIKTWIKTTVFCIVGGALIGLLCFLSICAWRDYGLVEGIVLAVITAGILALIIFGAIRGHKTKWKNY